MTSGSGKLTVVQTDGAPAAIGPYAQAIIAGGLVYTSGQIPLDPETMDVVPGGITEQSERVMTSLAAVLEAAGASLDAVIKTTCFVTDLADFAAFNEVYGRHFGDHRPARSTVQVAALPRGVKVEVEAIAAVGG
ncbi:MAG TPA: RidA family protein [Thermomicrobiales bacterium]|jgi:2-iminobutanoate/2-iminopropanoate deaminase|nr:RidA family protein [Thermomicrobiales bacterium]